MVQAIRNFNGVVHRLELVGVVDGVQYINDSFATAPERAFAALNSFDEPLIFLAGG
jgi:UDP-N-acetylmuramoylalanine--D-glutamate ligase